ncbi:hypothetical protein K1719_014847 [Acacia pycnantha]|nr:hypothetical protein K1719_014847 [Acacia pycnantha]
MLFQVGGNLTVDGIDYYITDAFGEGLYESCKEVKFGTMNSRAIQYIGAGAKNFKEWFAFVGRKAPLGVPGSPYAIMFQPNATASSGMRLMNVSTYSCGDVSLGCSCGDCPSSSVCSNIAPPTIQKMDSCSIRIGSLTVKCVDLILAILYIIMISVFLGWGLYYRMRERKPSPATKSVSNVVSGGMLHSLDMEKEENLPMQMLENASQIRHGVQLSAVQGYMSKIFRKYGSYVARNPVMVLNIS